MAYTTPDALINALAKVVEDLTPTGDAHTQDEYTRLGEVSWPDRSDSEKDRHFVVSRLSRGIPTMFGTVDEIDYDGSFLVEIGHALLHDETDGVLRRDVDLHQISAALEKKGNFPSGTSLIRWVGESIFVEEDYWRSVLTFNIWYVLAAP
jgi:hypothetical protein